MKPMIYKLRRYPSAIPRACPYCLLNLGITSYGILGCHFCQETVDRAMEQKFNVVHS